jgi:hypothetical protein
VPAVAIAVFDPEAFLAIDKVVTGEAFKVHHEFGWQLEHEVHFLTQPIHSHGSNTFDTGPPIKAQFKSLRICEFKP